MKERFIFNTVGLFTRDNKATVDFYTKTFGFTTDWDGIQPNVEMTLGDMRRRCMRRGRSRTCARSAAGGGGVSAR